MEKEQSPTAREEYLECEKWWIYALMMFAGGYYGAFTYSIRGGVFCNAQTGNFVLLAMAIGNGNRLHALYYFIPISAYCLGAFVSEFAESQIKKLRLIRWETLLVIIEIAVIIFLGFVPEDAPVQITQVLINLICSMQYNTFRQLQGVPMSTTFCTNHIRQVGIAICTAIRTKDGKNLPLKRMLIHLGMLFVFVDGGILSTVMCRIFLGRAIWVALVPLVIAAVDLLYSDIKKEKGEFRRIPHGHHK